MRGGGIISYGCIMLLCVFAGLQAGCTGTDTQKQADGNTTLGSDRLRASWTEVARHPIFDRTGMILSMSEKRFSVFVTSARPGLWTSRAGEILGLDPAELNHRLSGVDGMVCLSRAATLDEVKALRRCGIEGLKIYQGYHRRYPYGSMASSILGLVDPRGMGVAGVESFYDSFLRCSPGVADDGCMIRGLTLCIEKDLQISAEKELARQMHRLRAKRGCLVLMDASNGEILSMASLPGWDPEKYWEYDPADLHNAAITDAWDPVVLFPLLVRILDSPQISRKDSQESPAGVSGIHRASDLKWDWTELSDGLFLWSPWSRDNICLNINFEKILGKLYSLGLGRSTGIDLPREKIGGLPTTFPESWTEIDGLRASPIQILRAFSAIMAGGRMVVPHVAMDPVHKDANGSGGCAEELKWIGSKQTTALWKELSYRRRPYLVSVRQKDDRKSRKSCQIVLLGFWPAGQPRITYILALDQAARDPRKTRGTFKHVLRLADRAKSLVSFAKQDTAHKKICLRVKGHRMPDLRGLSMRQAYRILRDVDVEVRIRGTGAVVSQTPAAGTSLKGVKVCTIICKGTES